MEGFNFNFWLVIGLMVAFFAFRAWRNETRGKKKASGSLVVPPGVHHVQIDYMDQRGKMTTREITAHRHRGGKVYAYCHLRHGERTFLVENIIGPVTDMETGELLDAEAWAESL
ncbi:hypothetical protein [Halomonas sp. PBN3]|uniref:hypothetical protein n=1 Tax=Halomonas sp. PBN3 TaxID=1397528 RepID=UPI0003B7FF54|nr:hypothetical protein [Halomonas sp. PBN3]ERS88841.1 hypothetical protein Q671_07980 [Halomonas sp. PBN3]